MQTAERLENSVDLQSLIGDKPVLIDARKIRDGGIGIYTQNLVSDLVERSIPLALLGDPEKLAGFAWSDKVQVIAEHARPYSFEEFFTLPKRIKFEQFSLFHVPHYTLPFRVPIPTVVTVHDLIHLTHPHKIFHPPLAWAMVASALFRADAVVTVSESARQDIVRMFPRLIRRNRPVTVIQNRLADHFRGDQPQSDELAEQYLFVSVSQSRKHKGILDLLRAFTRAKELLETMVARGQAPRSALSVELVIAGYGSDDLLHNKRLARYLRNRSDIRIVGTLTHEQLIQFYGNASAVVVPSRAEGFGFPVIEAHSQGTPVVMRPVRALLELRSDHDFVAKDLSVDAFTDVLIAALCAPAQSEFRDFLRQRGRSFSADPFILPLIELYRQVILTARKG